MSDLRRRHDGAMTERYAIKKGCQNGKKISLPSIILKVQAVLCQNWAREHFRSCIKVSDDDDLGY
ncbi:hypothetical protein FO675_08005 [Riemerella anatipestifer]|uniref:hypothetical protein n=1 Tax=Riemerella anatipestifer TaxID=34085 RepID=UPI001AD7D3D8|nr:hypothetical protein [Riemerella anatipestifer]MBO4234233.1 hypothetical protein [Riemerella anatipestifer]